jgi:hypothetical protein
VPIPKARALAGTRLLTTGEQIDGIACQAGEQVLLHIHEHLTIFVRGVARQVPAAIGIAPPYQVEATPRGAFVAGGSCFMWLHTHSADGIIHTESPVNRTYTLGEFFDIWGQPFDREHVGPAQGPVTALFNGRVFTATHARFHSLRTRRSSSRSAGHSSHLSRSRFRTGCEQRDRPIGNRWQPHGNGLTHRGRIEGGATLNLRTLSERKTTWFGF